jgi:hypothetical protein
VGKVTQITSESNRRVETREYVRCICLFQADSRDIGQICMWVDEEGSKLGGSCLFVAFVGKKSKCGIARELL